MISNKTDAWKTDINLLTARLVVRMWGYIYFFDLPIFRQVWPDLFRELNYLPFQFFEIKIQAIRKLGITLQINVFSRRTTVHPALQYYFVSSLQIICWLDLPRSSASTLFSWPLYKKKLCTNPILTILNRRISLHVPKKLWRCMYNLSFSVRLDVHWQSKDKAFIPCRLQNGPRVIEANCIESLQRSNSSHITYDWLPRNNIFPSKWGLLNEISATLFLLLHGYYLWISLVSSVKRRLQTEVII